MGAFVDLSGQRFSRLLVKRRDDADKGSKVKWLCECDCGAELSVVSSHLPNGHTKSCGCLADEVRRKARLIDITGRRFGAWVVAGRTDSKRWLCSCDCGKKRHVASSELRSGRSKSCGCQARKTHGLSHHPLYQTWVRVVRSCTNPDSREYPAYGGRGIVVATEWEDDPSAFIEWVEFNIGARPKGKSLDRIDNDEGYVPGNLRWADAKSQANNRRSPLRSDIVKKICKLRDAGMSVMDICQELKIAVAEENLNK